VWRAFAEELGILGAMAPDAVGGSRGGPVEMIVIMEELGRALVVEPFLSTAVIAGGLLAHSGGPTAQALLARLVAGEIVAAFAFAEPHARYDWRDLKTTARQDGAGWVLSGAKAMVYGAPFATHLVVTARTAAASATRRGSRSSSSTRRPAASPRATIKRSTASARPRSRFDNVSLPAEALIGDAGGAAPLLERVIDEATVGLCAEAIGVLRALHERTVDYTKERQQFGKPLGTFQVLRHRMVDMYIALEQAVSITYLAAIRLSDPDRCNAPGRRRRRRRRSARRCASSASPPSSCTAAWG